MKNITLLLLACVGLSLNAQIASISDQELVRISDFVFRGKVIKKEPFISPITHYKYIKSTTTVKQVYKNKIASKDTIVELLTYIDEVQHSEVQNFHPDGEGVFFLIKDTVNKGYYKLPWGQVSVLRFDKKYGHWFNEHVYKKEYVLYGHLSKLEGLTIPDSLTSEELFTKRQKADSLESIKIRKLRIEEDNRRRQSEMSKNDSFAQHSKIDRAYFDSLSWQEQSKYRKKHIAARDSVINLQKERDRKKKSPKTK